uniref:Uncharacterized protein n=1 Tax=Zea mays TaxID=4577 RepID=C0P7J8_MAIZE|nr:unknown [Zea mays]
MYLPVERTSRRFSLGSYRPLRSWYRCVTADTVYACPSIVTLSPQWMLVGKQRTPRHRGGGVISTTLKGCLCSLPSRSLSRPSLFFLHTTAKRGLWYAKEVDATMAMGGGHCSLARSIPAGA